MKLLSDSPLQSQELLFVGMISLFSFSEHLTGKCNRMVTSIVLLLEQNSTQTLSRGISL